MSRNTQSPPNYSNQQGMPQHMQQPAMLSRMPAGGAFPTQGAPGGGKNTPQPPGYSNQQGMPPSAPGGGFFGSAVQKMQQGRAQQGGPGGGFFGSALQKMQQGRAQQGMKPPQAMPGYTNQQGMPPQGAPGQFRPPPGQFRMPGQPAPGQPPQGAPGMAPPPGAPGMAPPPGGPEQDQMYRQMLMNKGGGPGKAKTAGMRAQMAYQQQYGTGYDPNNKVSWMDNPSKKQRKAMSRATALRGKKGRGRGY